MGNYLCDPKECTGCFSCLNICPVNSISRVLIKGFWYPKVDESTCIDCKKCFEVCPILHRTDRFNPNFDVSAYACINKNKNIRKVSSSGGIFTILAENILKDGGIVFGASFNKTMEVRHIAVEKIGDLSQLRGSKYVQSNIGTIYRHVKKCVEEKREVLFTGTPCQIDGLYSFLPERYDNLFTCDLVCHGTPSPVVFSKYIKFFEEKYSSKIVSFNFRNKDNGWSDPHIVIRFSNGKIFRRKLFLDKFGFGFGENIFLRESCYNCKYASLKRYGDITLGDFWGIEPGEIINSKIIENGVSLVLINSEKGMNIFKGLMSDIIFEERSIAEAVNGNPQLSVPSKRHYTGPDFNRAIF